MITLNRIKTESISKLKERMKKGKVWNKKRRANALLFLVTQWLNAKHRQQFL
jgi:hypothetical protein